MIPRITGAQFKGELRARRFKKKTGLAAEKRLFVSNLKNELDKAAQRVYTNIVF